MKATLKKIENVKELFNKYVDMQKEDDRLQKAMWVDETHYNCGKHYDWCKHYDELCAMEKKVRRAVRQLAKELGFNVKTKLHYDSEIRETIERIEYQYKKEMRAFYEVGWCGNYDSYIEVVDDEAFSPKVELKDEY